MDTCLGQKLGQKWVHNYVHYACLTKINIVIVMRQCTFEDLENFLDFSIVYKEGGFYITYKFKVPNEHTST